MLNVLLLGDVNAILHPSPTTSPYYHFGIDGTDKPYLVFCGLQVLLKESFTQKITAERVEEFLWSLKNSTQYTPEQLETISEAMLKLQEVGEIPLFIKAFPEGTIAKQGNAFMSMRVTNDSVPWIAEFLRPLFSKVFLHTMRATEVLKYKMMFEDFALTTTGLSDQTDKQLVDNSANPYNYPINIFFTATQNKEAVGFIKEFYQTDLSSELVENSLPEVEVPMVESILGYKQRPLGNIHPVLAHSTFDSIVQASRKLVEEKEATNHYSYPVSELILDPEFRSPNWELVSAEDPKTYREADGVGVFIGKAGRIRVDVVRDEEQEKFTYSTTYDQDEDMERGGRLLPVFKDGTLHRDWTFEQVRMCAEYHRDHFRD